MSYTPKGGHGYGNNKHRSAKSFQASRSKRSQSMDARKSAPIAKSEQQWMNDPAHFDLEGIDTPNYDAAYQEGLSLVDPEGVQFPRIIEETPEAFFYGNFPQNQFFIVRRWDDGDKVQFAHHFPRGDGQFPEGYPSLKAAQDYIQKWEGVNLKGESMRGSKIVDAKEAASYPVPKRY